MNTTIKLLLAASASILTINGCVESSQQITLPNGKQATEYTSLILTEDSRHLFSRFASLMHKRGFKMNISMINVHGSKTVTLKVKEWQTSGLDFSLHPMTLNGVKPVGCKSSKEPGYAIRYMECTYDKQALIKSMGKPYGPAGKGWKLNGLIVDESPNGTLSEAWKCSQKYLYDYFETENMLKRVQIGYKASDCVKKVYKIYRPTPGPIEDYFSYPMAAYGNKHYRFSVRSNEDFINFLSK